MSESSGPRDAEHGPTGVAHNARVWNYWLGGKDYYDVDGQVGDHVTGMYPIIGEVARADRAFLGRAVTHLAGEAGIRQFLDIGTGLPTVDNTHEVAQRIAPESRIVYVDNDPTVLLHANALLTSSPKGVTDYIEADAHDPDTILRAAGRTLDFDRPVAVMMLGILNFVLDTEEARSIVERLVAAVPSGSYLVLTHPTVELGGEANTEAMRFWNENATPPITARTRAEVAGFFEALELLDPGIVSCSHWRPEATSGSTDEPQVVPQFGAVARKP
ncbi:SAM-dependent methyltransferase [Streptomyces iconiensis]|uniref:SAM-dependent methyltransferase n=1 Tax=Streptomyces iconiensis TaxID=1384038 RepID=A0ABT6ZVA1_9ACTN|nr:SAM-dependent methyltransferase [Streptomyces iconiensis]MDJ1132991.1 SAM-dependent methyltransferase [Streptomyces iconiensis]